MCIKIVVTSGDVGNQDAHRLIDTHWVISPFRITPLLMNSPFFFYTFIAERVPRSILGNLEPLTNLFVLPVGVANLRERIINEENIVGRGLRKNPTKRDRFSPLLIESRGLKDIRVLMNHASVRGNSKYFLFSHLFLANVWQNVLAIRRLFSHKRIRLARQYHLRYIFKDLLSPWQKEAHNRMSNDRRPVGRDRCENF